MRLKSLELVGFKSFVDRTNINFEDGVTGIVGPNGCGKSNVVDAIRWVMGEQSAKHLRGSQMGDVIFNGTESRPPMGMASVFLTFDNSDHRAPAEYADYSEITVGRRLYRSGESEYYINKTPCRLRDIIDIFLGTGIGTKAYAIVEQGMIGQILSAKPEDRRTLIEEAAGISKFKVRKEAALRKMDSTKTNLARLSDILQELDRQINSLYRQAKKAERFKEYTDELKDLELAVSAHNFEELSTELDHLKKSIESTKETEVSGDSELSKEEAEVESARIKIGELELELDRLQELLYAKQNEVQLTEAGVTYSSKEVEGLTLQIERWTSEIEDLNGKIDGWRAELSGANTGKVAADLKWLSAKENLTGLDDVISALRDEHHQLVVGLEDSRKKVFECVETVSISSSHLEQTKRRDKEIEAWLIKDQTEIDTIDMQIKELQGKAGARSGDVTGTRQLRLELDEELKATDETLTAQKEELARSEEIITGLREELNTKRSRLNSLRELYKNYEGYKDGVKAVLKRCEEAQDFSGVLGTINDIVEARPEYESAVGAALGEKLQCVVVKSHEVGVEAIDYLKAQASGRSTFIPMELRCAEEADSSVCEEEGVIGPLTNFVSFADDYKKVVGYLFSDVILVKDLNNALNAWNKSRSNHTFVTLDGDVVDPAGVVTGGSGGDASGQLMVHRREMQELANQVATLSTELNVAEEMHLKLKARVKGLEKNIEKLSGESRHEELKLVNQEKDLHHLEYQLSYLNSQRDKLTLEVASLAEEQKAVKREHENSRAAYEVGFDEKARLEAGVIRSQEKEGELRDRLQSLVERRTELNVAVKTEREKTEALERDIVRLLDAIAEGFAGVASRGADITSAADIIKTSSFGIDCKNKYLHCLIQEINGLKGQHTEIKNSYDVDSAVLCEKEIRIRELRKSHDDQVKKMHDVEINFTEKREKLGYLCREIFDRYRINLEQSYREHISKELDINVSTERVRELKDKVERIGSVNVDAITEYDELKVRYDFLKKQHDDLTASMEDLQKAIQKINKTSKVRFQEAFDSVNERFQKLFPKLFEGGKARLLLTDENDVLESGVDIIAQPPGKKLQSITLLSGGEKALTAVALIFALFLHHPSPFCLLDEVDAPLDDANIDRFNELIREMTKLSQFILITHNKRTMELADTLYGVTMEEQGASRVISLSLTDKKDDAKAA